MLSYRQLSPKVAYVLQQKCFLMPRKCSGHSDIFLNFLFLKVYFFLLFFIIIIIILLQGKNSCAKKNLAVRKEKVISTCLVKFSWHQKNVCVKLSLPL